MNPANVPFSSTSTTNERNDLTSGCASIYSCTFLNQIDAYSSSNSKNDTHSEVAFSKISSSKVNTLALKIRDWLTQENSMDSVSLRKECLYMSFSILERNAKIDAENQKVNTVKINRSSLFSHAEKLFQFRMEGV